MAIVPDAKENVKVLPSDPLVFVWNAVKYLFHLKPSRTMADYKKISMKQSNLC